jgi:hypothetical protein
MTISDETLMAFVDGELSPQEMSRVEAVLHQQPELEAMVEQQRALRHELHASFESIMNAPLPDALRHTAMNAPVSLQWRFRRALQSLFAPRALIWTGIPAAALACGVVVGVLLDGGNSLMGTSGNSLVARGSLASALNQQLASAQATQGPQIGVSFRDKSGRYCRTFNASNLAGVACRDAASWNIAALSESPKEPTGAYATAGSTMPDLVRNAVQGMIAGSPLNAAAEKQARDQGWKAQ